MKASWKPIKTAPKDGTEILVCNNDQGGMMRIIYYYQTEEQWRWEGFPIAYLHDTHWMPLPKRPRKAKP